MNKVLPILIIVFLITRNIHAQSNQGARFAALGNSGVAMQDLWSAQNNQAGLSSIKNLEFAASYENKYGIKELNNISAVVAIPIKKFVFAASFNSFGINSYKENKTGFSLARAWGDKVFIALNANYHQLKIQNYGNSNTFSIEAGIQYRATNKLLLASHLSNPNQSGFEEASDQLIPTTMSFGASYEFNNKLRICGEIIQFLDAGADVRSGIEYSIIDLFSLRGGVSVNTFKQYAGFGLNVRQLKIDFAVSSHPVLGYSPQISMGYGF